MTTLLLCKDCSVPLSSENWRASDQKYSRRRCSNCARSKQNAWRKNNPRTDSRSRLLATRGLNEEDYNLLLHKQGGKCAICRRTQNTQRSNNLFVDHCHKTQKVRGLLCHKCNTGLGHFEDRLTYLIAAIKYLALRQ